MKFWSQKSVYTTLGMINPWPGVAGVCRSKTLDERTVLEFWRRKALTALNKYVRRNAHVTSPQLQGDLGLW